MSLTVANDAGSDTAVQGDFITVTVAGLGITGQEPGEVPPAPAGTNPPQIRIS